MSDANSFLDSDDSQYQDGSEESFHDNDSRAGGSWDSSAHQPSHETDSAEPESGFDNSFGGLVPQESRKERRRRLAMEREAQEQQQAQNAAQHVVEVHAQELADTHDDAGSAGEPPAPKKSAMAFASGFFKKKSRKQAETPSADAPSDANDTAAQKAVEFSLPMMATIDPAMLYEYGLDPNTLGSMGIDPSTLPQFEAQFLDELGINPNIVVDILRRQYGPSSQQPDAHAESHDSGSSRQAWVHRFQVAKKWAPAAAAALGISATGAIWFMASGDDAPGEVPKIATNSPEPGKEKETGSDVKTESPENSPINEPGSNETDTLVKAEPVPTTPVPEVADTGTALPPADEIPAAEPAKTPDSEIPIVAAAAAPAALTDSGLPALPPGESLSSPPPSIAPGEAPPLPGIAAIGDAPPLPPTGGAEPAAAPAQPLETNDVSKDLPPIADLKMPATPPPGDAPKHDLASDIPPIAGIGAAVAGADALAGGKSEVPPITADSLTGLPGLPVDPAATASAAAPPPDLPPVAKADELPLPTGEKPPGDALATAPPASGAGTPEPKATEPPAGLMPDLPAIAESKTPEIADTKTPEKSVKLPIAAGVAGLATGIGAANLTDNLSGKSAGIDVPENHAAELPKTPAAEPPKAPAELAAADNMPAGVLPKSNELNLDDKADLAPPGTTAELAKPADLPQSVTAKAAKSPDFSDVAEITAKGVDAPPPSLAAGIGDAALPKMPVDTAPPKMPVDGADDRPAKPSTEVAASGSTTTNKAGIPIAQEHWLTIPNGRGRVLRSIANSVDSQDSLAMAGTTAVGVGAGMVVSQVSGAPGNVVVRYAEPIAPTDISPIKHTVQSGENFWTISRDYYGSGRYYKALWSANQQIVSKIDQLHVGDSIKIPAMETLDKSLIETPTLSKNRRESSTGAGQETPQNSRSLDNKAVRTGNAIESVPTGGEPDAAVTRPSNSTPRRREIISEPVGETSAKSYGKRYRVESGDTVRTIARDILGDPRRSNEIVSMNPDELDDERTILRPGQVLRMPDDPDDEE